MLLRGRLSFLIGLAVMGNFIFVLAGPASAQCAPGGADSSPCNDVIRVTTIPSASTTAEVGSSAALGSTPLADTSGAPLLASTPVVALVMLVGAGLLALLVVRSP
jgi:hypothetical protein